MRPTSEGGKEAKQRSDHWQENGSDLCIQRTGSGRSETRACTSSVLCAAL